MSIIVTSIESLPQALKILTNKDEIIDKDNSKKPITIDEAKEKYIRAENSTIEATPEIAAIVDDLNKVEELKNKLLDTEENLKLKIMNYMQFNNKLTFNDQYLVTWKSANRTTFDLKAFRTEFPEMYELYQKDIKARIFKLC
ncbi:MAG TPA: hypothetical protein LFW21_01795 [Rickettsia endosymbiont of Pyrocoelia pectoralis]|nr:hypothetical protein [Rickettsia endosymbiont of Pyrocoelia pectoralis]